MKSFKYHIPYITWKCFFDVPESFVCLYDSDLFFKKKTHLLKYVFELVDKNNTNLIIYKSGKCVIRFSNNTYEFYITDNYFLVMDQYKLLKLIKEYDEELLKRVDYN